MSNTIKLDVVKSDALVDIQVSGNFIFYCQETLKTLSNNMGTEKTKSAIERFKKKEPASDFDEQLMFIFIALVGEMEKKAIAQNKTETKEFTQEELKALIGD